MTLIRRIPNSEIVAVDQSPQTETPPQSETQLNISFGIADSADQFEAAPQNLYYLEQQAQSASLILPPTNRDITVEASSLFSSYDTSVGQLDNRLPQLMDRFSSLTERKNELQSQIDIAEGEMSKAQQMLAAVIEVMNSNLPITDELRALLGPLGIIGTIAELPIIPGVFGLRAVVMQRLQKIKTELEQQIGGMAMNVESLKSQLSEVESEIKSVSDKIANEKERQEKEASPFQTRDPMTSTDSIVADEQLWQEHLSNQNLIQKENAPAADPFNPIARMFADEE